MSLFQWTVLVLLLALFLLLAVVLAVAINARNLAKAAKEEAEQERLHHDSKPYATTNDILGGLEQMLPGVLNHLLEHAAIASMAPRQAVGGSAYAPAIAAQPYAEPFQTEVAFQPDRAVPFTDAPPAPQHMAGYREVPMQARDYRTGASRPGGYEPRRDDRTTSARPGRVLRRPQGEQRVPVGSLGPVAPISAPPAPAAPPRLDHPGARTQLDERARRLRNGILGRVGAPSPAPTTPAITDQDRQRREDERDPLGINKLTDTTEFRLDQAPPELELSQDPAEATQQIITSTQQWSLAFRAPSGEQPVVGHDDAAGGTAAPQSNVG